MNEQPISPLPLLASIFRGIKTGHHWCYGDPEYAELNSGRFDEYKAFFSQLNLTLHHDPRGFYFATTDDDEYKGTETIAKFVVFTAVWIDALADQGSNLGMQLFESSHMISELPHFASENHRRHCQLVGIADRSELLNLLRALDRLGFLKIDEHERFTLRESFHRFIDVCPNFKAKDQAPTEDHISQPAE